MIHFNIITTRCILFDFDFLLVAILSVNTDCLQPIASVSFVTSLIHEMYLLFFIIIDDFMVCYILKINE